MKLKKAIELNEDSERSLRDHKHIDHADAIKLGNEALKRVKLGRDCILSSEHVLLPGED